MMKFASLALLFSLSLVGGRAQAQMLDVNTNATVGNDAGVWTNTTVDGNAETDIANMSDDSSTNDGPTTDTSAAMNSGSDISFRILRSEMDEGTDFAVTEAGSVRTAASLESYAVATIRANDRLDSVEMNNGQMDMVYRKPAKLLWIIPASLKVHVSVSQEGEVAVQYPWYVFLLSTDESRLALETEIRREVESIDESVQLAASAEVVGTTSTGVQRDPMIRRWARIIEAAYLAVSGSVSAEASS